MSQARWRSTRPGSWWDPVLSAGFLGIFGCAVGLGVGVPVSVSLFLERRKALRQHLVALPPEQRLQVLLPLQGARGDTGRLVAPFLREFVAATELTPAPAPGGRGSELTAGSRS